MGVRDKAWVLRFDGEGVGMRVTDLVVHWEGPWVSFVSEGRVQHTNRSVTIVAEGLKPEKPNSKA